MTTEQTAPQAEIEVIDEQVSFLIQTAREAEWWRNRPESPGVEARIVRIATDLTARLAAHDQSDPSEGEREKPVYRQGDRGKCNWVPEGDNGVRRCTYCGDYDMPDPDEGFPQ